MSTEEWCKICEAHKAYVYAYCAREGARKHLKAFLIKNIGCHTDSMIDALIDKLTLEFKIESKNQPLTED